MGAGLKLLNIANEPGMPAMQRQILFEGVASDLVKMSGPGKQKVVLPPTIKGGSK